MAYINTNIRSWWAGRTIRRSKVISHRTALRQVRSHWDSRLSVGAQDNRVCENRFCHFTGHHVNFCHSEWSEESRCWGPPTDGPSEQWRVNTREMGFLAGSRLFGV